MGPQFQILQNPYFPPLLPSLVRDFLPHTVTKRTETYAETTHRVLRGEITVQAGEVCGHSLTDCVSSASPIHWHSVEKHSASLS